MSAIADSSLETMSSARADFSGSVRRHWSSSTPRIASSTLRSRPSSSLIRSRGTLPAASHLSAMSRIARLAAVEVRHRDQRLGLDQQRLLDHGVGGVLLVLLGLGGVARAEERVLGGPEPLPQLLVDVAGRRAGGLPVAHQVAVGAGGGSPVGGAGERLRLLDQPLLHDPGALALLLLLGEVDLAAPGVGGAGGGEPPPQRVVGGLVDPRERLPLVEQVAQPVGATAPVVAVGELLGLGDDGLLGGLGLRGLRGPLLLARLALGGEHGGEGVEPAGERRRGRPPRWPRRPGRGRP